MFCFPSFWDVQKKYEHHDDSGSVSAVPEEASAEPEENIEAPTDTPSENPCEEGRCWDFEAETDFVHEQGFVEGAGWMCSMSAHLS